MANVISGGQLQRLGAPIPPVDATLFTRGPYAAWADIGILGREDPIEMWKSQPSVRKVVDFIARALASTPLKVYRRVSDTDRQRLTDHPVAKILATPSVGMTPFRFWHSVVVDALLYDRWCVVKTDSGDPGRPVDLTRVQAARVNFADDGLANVAVVWVDGTVQLEPTNCLYDHGYAPIGANGTTPMATLHAILQESREAVEYRRGIWKNAARIPTVIQRPAGNLWSPEAKANFLAGWRKYMRDGRDAGGTPILEDGMTLAKVEAFTPRDTQDIEGRQLNDAEVASAYHIAPELVGARTGNYSNVAAFRQALYGDALGPYYEPLQQVVNAMLVPDLDDTGEVYVEFDIEAKMRGSWETQAAVTSMAVGGPWMLRSEARARNNLPFVEGTDELIVPMNVTEGGQASPLDSGSQNENHLDPKTVALSLIKNELSS